MSSHDFVDLYTRDPENCGPKAARDELGLIQRWLETHHVIYIVTSV
jgi:hypothetical protein